MFFFPFSSTTVKGGEQDHHGRDLAGTGLAQNAMDTRHDFLITRFTILMIAIVFCTLIFESIEHGIMHVAEMHKEIHGSIYHDVLIRIKNELMILGLLSFVLVFLEESLDLSDAELHTFHYAHLLVFMIAVTFAIQGGFIIFYTKQSRYRWRFAEQDVKMQIPNESRKDEKLSPKSLHRRMRSWLRGERNSEDSMSSPGISIDDENYTALDNSSASCLGRLREASHFVFTSNQVDRMIRFRVVRRMFASMYVMRLTLPLFIQMHTKSNHCLYTGTWKMQMIPLDLHRQVIAIGERILISVCILHFPFRKMHWNCWMYEKRPGLHFPVSLV
jgi:hypothetical protein